MINTVSLPQIMELSHSISKTLFMCLPYTVEPIMRGHPDERPCHPFWGPFLKKS